MDQRAHLLPMVKKQGRFGVSVLKDSSWRSRGISRRPKRTRDGSQARDSLSLDADGIPLLEDALVHMACNVAASYVAGDHTIFIGEVESTEVFDGEPLLFFRGGYRRIGP